VLHNEFWNCKGIYTFVELVFVFNTFEPIFKKILDYCEFILNKSLNNIISKSNTSEQVDKSQFDTFCKKTEGIKTDFDQIIKNSIKYLRWFTLFSSVILIIFIFCGGVEAYKHYNIIWATPIPASIFILWLIYLYFLLKLYICKLQYKIYVNFDKDHKKRLDEDTIEKIKQLLKEN